MAWDIVFVEPEKPGRPGGKGRAVGENARAVGENIFLRDLPKNPKVFAFLFPGSDDSDELKEGLRVLGEKTGDNLYVDLNSSLADPDYQAARRRFKLGPLPAIVVTAISPLAATPTGETGFVRLDGKALLAKPEQLVRTVEELFNLFLGGEIAAAVRRGWIAERGAALAAAAARVWAIFQPVITWLGKAEYEFNIAEGTIAVKPSGGRG